MCNLFIKCPTCGRMRDGGEIYPDTSSDCLPQPCRICKSEQINPKKDYYLCYMCKQVKHIDLMARSRFKKMCKACYNQSNYNANKENRLNKKEYQNENT
jgi:hypothetical protein